MSGKEMCLKGHKAVKMNMLKGSLLPNMVAMVNSKGKIYLKITERVDVKSPKDKKINVLVQGNGYFNLIELFFCIISKHHMLYHEYILHIPFSLGR